MAEFHSRIVLPRIHELLSHVDRVETRPQEVPARAQPAAPLEAGCGSGSATPSNHYTYHAPLPDLSRFALFPRDESDRREQWHNVPRQYTPPARHDARPPPVASVAVAAPAPAPYPSPRSPSQRWPSPTHSHSGSRHGSCRCCYGGYAQEGHSPRDYRERDYHDAARAHRDYHENGYGGVHSEGWYPPGTHGHSGHGHDLYSPGPSVSRPAGRQPGGSPVLSEHSRGKKKRPNLSKEAVEIMMAWIDSHIENPFERQDRPELVERTGLEEKQVTDWFTNFRRRKWAKYRVDLYSREIAKWKAVRRAALDEAARLDANTSPSSSSSDASLSRPQANNHPQSHHHHHPHPHAHAQSPTNSNANANAVVTAAARRAAEADAARCAAEQSYLRAKDEYERWVGEQRDKRGDSKHHHRRKTMGSLAGEGEEEDDEFDEDD